MSASETCANALDHVIVVLFENRSLHNLLGRLYGPEDGKTFEGVIGKDLSNPIPEWAEHGADRKVVPYTVATDMVRRTPTPGSRVTLRALVTSPYLDGEAGGTHS